MPNDIPDWTGQQLEQLVSVSGQFMGDLGSPTQAPDAVTITPSVDPSGATTDPAVLASFKAAAGSIIAQVGNLGAFLTGTNTAVNPQWGQATSAGNFGLAWVESDSADATTAAAGWAFAVRLRTANGLAAALWFKPNLGAAEAPPQFTAAGGLGPMTAQLGEFSGVALAAPTDRIASGQTTSSSIRVAAGSTDAQVGDLVAFSSHWGWASNVKATFVETLNNNMVVVHAGDDSSIQQNHHASHGYAIGPQIKLALPVGVQAWPYDVQAASLPAVGATATIVLAATPGKTYTCAAMSLSLLSTTAAIHIPSVSLLDGAATIWVGQMGVQAVIGDKDRIERTEVAHIGTAGNSMTLGFSGNAAGGQHAASIGAYLR